MAEFIAPEIIPFIWFGGIAITIYVFFHKFSDVIKEKFRQTNLTRRKEERSGNTDGQVDDLISGAPRMLNEVNKIIQEQKASGVPDEQMKGLLQKKTDVRISNKQSGSYQYFRKTFTKKSSRIRASYLTW